MNDWNAETYHRVSNPQFGWGLRVLERLPLAGNEVVLDVGCGTGRLTARILEQLTSGGVIGLDRSETMLVVARDFLRPRFGDRIQLLRADAASLPLVGCVDAIFSTATFHWVLDHDTLFASLHRALKANGRLVAQCGGVRNLARLHDRAAALMRETPLSSHFESWGEPWEFADAETTARRLAAAGFEDIATRVEWSPTIQPDAAAFAEFVTNVICRPHLTYLPTPDLRSAFIDRLTQLAANDDPPFELDYWRLNIEARKPAVGTRG